MAKEYKKDIEENRKKIQKMRSELVAVKDAKEVSGRAFGQIVSSRKVKSAKGGSLDLSKLPAKQKKILEDFQNTMEQRRAEIMASTGQKKTVKASKMKRMV